ncbi:MAG: hydroxymethylglutaryl-CoA lyase [Ignavibacteriae bacterium]|nr:hydroxymethylglutaryl-CoA lyase [Ignavibacteriota bacterium]
MKEDTLRLNCSGLEIHEVGMRDGLQMEKQVVPLEKKIEWINRLIDSGFDIIQVGSFVRADKVPQMADTAELFKGLRSLHSPLSALSSLLSALVLNEKGLERALECEVPMICMGVSASETHSMKNTGMSISDATDRIIAMAKMAEGKGHRVQVSVQSAFGCGYEGHVPQERVMTIVGRYFDAGLKNISLADTAGHATPDQVEKMFSAILEFDEGVECACHFHNTYGLALANCYAAMKVGVKSFESSVAGLGGCPFTKIAGGNTCTEDFVHMLQRTGMREDVKLTELVRLADDVDAFFGKEVSSAVRKVGPLQLYSKSEL